MIRITAKYKDRCYNVKMKPDVRVGEFQFKIRKYLKIRPEEAIFLMFERGGIITTREVIYPHNKTIGDVFRDILMDPLVVNIMSENCFGA